MRSSKSLSCLLIGGFILLAIFVSVYGQDFRAWNFLCLDKGGGVYECSLFVDNHLGEDAVILFLYTNNKGKVVSAPIVTAKQGSGPVASVFYCGSVQPGSYNVFWKAYRKSDQSLAREVAWSKTYEIQQITCPEGLMDKYAQAVRLRADLARIVLEGFRRKIVDRQDINVVLDQITVQYLRDLGKQYIKEFCVLSGDPLICELFGDERLTIEDMIKRFTKYTNDMLRAWFEDQALKDAEDRDLPRYLSLLEESIEDEAIAWKEHDRSRIESNLTEQAYAIGRIEAICDCINKISSLWPSEVLDRLSKLAGNIFWNTLKKEWTEWLGLSFQEDHELYRNWYNGSQYECYFALGPAPGPSTQVSLISGWNSIFIGTDQDLSRSELDNRCYRPIAFGIKDGVFSEERGDLESGRGYFVKVSSDCSLTLNGNLLHPGLNLNTGWNMTGVTEKMALSALLDKCTRLIVFGIKNGQFYEERDALEPMKGYLIRVDGPCQIPAGAEGLLTALTEDATYEESRIVSAQQFDKPMLTVWLKGENARLWKGFDCGEISSGEKKTCKILEVCNANEFQPTTLSWSIKADNEWIKFKPASNWPPLSMGKCETVDVIMDATGLLAGSYEANITVEAPGAVLPASESGAVTIKVTGGGPKPNQPNIQISPSSLDFDKLQVNTSKNQTLRISNTGQASLHITSISSDNPRFTVKGSTSFSIEPGGSQDVTITFTPQAEGTQSGKLTISSNDPDKPAVTVQLTGTGFAPKPGEPVASFTFSPASPNVEDVVTFDASSSMPSVPGGSISSYSWDFGDGASGTGKIATHKYDREGSYTVRLTITDDQSKIDSESKIIHIVKEVLPKSLKEIVAALIPGDPTGVSDPDRFIGDSEIWKVVKSNLIGDEILPEIGYKVTKSMVIDILPYWIFNAAVDKPSPVKATAPATLMAARAEAQNGQAVISRREISATKVKPGESFFITLTIYVKEDTNFIGVADILPDGWKIEGNNVGFFITLSSGDVKTVSYRVTVLPDAKPGLYSITGAVKSLFGGDEPIGGDSQIEVWGEGALSIAEVIAGSDSIIDDTEIMNAIQLWISGNPVPGTGQTISDEQILELIAYWITGTKIDQPVPQMRKQSLDEGLSSLIARAGNNQLSVHAFNARPNPSRNGRVSFRVEGTGIESIRAQVYDLTGRLAFDSSFVPGHELSWNLLNNQGQALANGVYLYIVTVRGFSSEVIRSEVRKLVILR